MPEEDPEHVKDDATASSEDTIDDVDPKSRNKFYVKLFLIAALVAGVLGISISFAKGSPNENTTFVEEPPFEEEPTAHDFVLINSHLPASAADAYYYGDGAWDVMTWIDEKGCINVHHDDTGDVYDAEPLCDNYKDDIRSLYANKNVVGVARGGNVEFWISLWDRDSNGYKLMPYESPLTKGNVVSKPEVPGFGKKLLFDKNSNVLVASDVGVHHFSLDRQSGWVAGNIWQGALGFDMDPEETTLAIYDASEVMVHNMDDEWWWPDYEPIVFASNDPIASLAVHNGAVHVVTTQGSVVVVTSNFSDDTKTFSEPTKILDDMVLELDSGHVFDVRKGSFLGVSFDGASDVFKVKAAGNRVIAFLERSGIKMIEVYEA